MSERLIEKIDRLGAEAGIETMTPEIRRFALLVRQDTVAQWPDFTAQQRESYQKGHNDGVAHHKQAVKAAQPEQKQTGIREIRVTETVKQEQEEDWDAMGQKILVATARDTKRTWEDAAVKAVHKLMQEEQEPVERMRFHSDMSISFAPSKEQQSCDKREWVDLTDEQLMECTVHNRFEYDPPYINNVGETRVARHEVALRATYENINSKLKELNT